MEGSSGSSGSATGNPRNKVALKPGHSLMDWIRLGNSGEDLSGTKGAFIDVPRATLERHNTRDDAWLCIRGKVYNVTRYMDFHPGGPEELMKGVGKDATTLFQSIHPWVNYESILAKCLVGRLRNIVDVHVFDNPVLQEEGEDIRRNSSDHDLSSPGVEEVTLKEFDWFEQLESFTVVVNKKNLALKEVVADCRREGELWLWLGRVPTVGWTLATALDWPPRFSLTDLRLEVRLSKRVRGLWSKAPLLPAPPQLEPLLPNSPVTLASLTPVNHNVFLVGLLYSTRVAPFVPIGHHLHLRANIKGVEVERNYTPVVGVCEELDPSRLWFLIKVYPDGAFTSWLGGLRPGEALSVSQPLGTFSLTALARRAHLVLLAAGTGLTPMLRVIMWAIKHRYDRKMKVKLIFFNKTEKDVIWREHLEKLAIISDRFTVEHVLSEPDPSWTGHRGFITLQLIQNFLPDFNEDLPWEYYTCVCGPISFTQLAERYIKGMGYSSDHFFCFKG